MNWSAQPFARLAMATFIAASMTALLRADYSLYAPATCQEVHRAGSPLAIARWARPQNPCANGGYYVGGGAFRYKCDNRCCNQGTWGWDYTGRCIKPLVRLGWTQPPRYLGGTGSYKPDGPRPCEELHAAHEESHACHE